MPLPLGSCPPPARLVHAISLLQEKWVLFIVLSLLEGPQGFNELSRRARGVNTTTLSQRLELLEQEGIVTKTIQSTMPPKTSYELTAAGKALKDVLKAIYGWGEKHLDETVPAECELGGDSQG